MHGRLPALALAALLAGCTAAPKPPSLTSDVRSTRPSDYARLDRETVIAVGRVQSLRLMPVLDRALADPELRAPALWAVGQMAFGEYWDPSRANELVPRVPLPDGAEALGKLGVGEAELRACLPDIRAARGLFWLASWHKKPLADETVAALGLAIVDPDPEVRFRVAGVFMRVAEPRAAPWLRVALRDPDERVRFFALRCLARVPDEAEAAIHVALDDESARVRAEACRAAQTAERTEILPIDGLRRDPSTHLRALAAEATGEFLDDPSPFVRGTAFQAFARIRGPDAMAVIDRGLGDESAWVRICAARSARSVEQVRRALADPDERVRSAGAEALENVEGATELIAELLARERSVTLLGPAVGAAKDPALLPALRSLGGRCVGPDFVEMREGLVDAYAALGAWPEVLRLAGDDAPSVRAKAERSLAEHERRTPREPEVALYAPGPYATAAPGPADWVLETDRGTIRIELQPDLAPAHVAAIVDLTERGFYDGLTFHRVVPNFVVQGGDPTGTGWGGPGFLLRDEISDAPFERGAVGMAKAGKDTGGSQLFIMLMPAPHLEGRYTIFGRVVEGMEAVDTIEPCDRIVRARIERR